MDVHGRDAEVEAAIDGTKTVFVDALKNGDPGLASTAYAEDARALVPSTELLVGRQAIEAFWSAGVEAGISDVELHSLALERDDDVACEIGRYSLTLSTEDGLVVDRGNYMLIHKRQEDGSWLRAVEMLNPDTPPTTAAGSNRTEEAQ
jgi:ketosteroid isomerase-like protein